MSALKFYEGWTRCFVFAGLAVVADTDEKTLICRECVEITEWCCCNIWCMKLLWYAIAVSRLKWPVVCLLQRQTLFVCYCYRGSYVFVAFWSLFRLFLWVNFRETFGGVDLGTRNSGLDFEIIWIQKYLLHWKIRHCQEVNTNSHIITMAPLAHTGVMLIIHSRYIVWSALLAVCTIGSAFWCINSYWLCCKHSESVFPLFFTCCVALCCSLPSLTGNTVALLPTLFCAA